VLVVATFFAAGDERMKRIAAAFDWQGVMMPANFRVDAWVSPPPYTGRPPAILPGLRPGEPVQAAAALAVPAGNNPLGDPRVNSVQQAIREAAEKGGYRYRSWKVNDLEPNEGYGGDVESFFAAL
jgi:Domain of unknown function (DUF4175)